MARQRFLAIWLGFGLLYLVVAAWGPNGLRETGIWPQTNQHLLQVRAWRGEDIEVPDGDGSGGELIEVTPRLDVTPYFDHWPIQDDRERVLLTNIACGVRPDSGDGQLEPIQYVPADSVAGRLQLRRMECHVGSPLGPAFLMYPLRVVLRSALAAQWLGALLGGLAVALMDVLMLWWLESVRGEATAGRGERFLLLLLAGLGTLWVWLVPQGEVWFFAQTVATTCLALALVLAFRGHSMAAGLAFAIAVTSRPPVIFAVPLLLAMLLSNRTSRSRLRTLGRQTGLRAVVLMGVGPALIGGLHLVLNHLRFGSALQFGYRFMLTPAELRSALEQHGQLNLAFLGTNLRYLFVQPPVAVVTESGGLTFPYLASDPLGMGIVFSTPAALAVVLAIGGRWRGRVLVAACWVSLVLVTIPSLLYFNTGWVQWGARYLLDAWPMWLMLTALGLGRIKPSIAWALVGLSVASNVWAAVLTTFGFWP